MGDQTAGFPRHFIGLFPALTRGAGPQASDAGIRAGSPLGYCAWFAVVVLAGKAVNWGLPDRWTFSASMRYFLDMFMVTHEDFLFILALGWLGAVGLHLARNRPGLRRAVWVAWLAIYALCVLYAVASVAIFHALKTPLTYPLLRMAGNLKVIRSSLDAYASAGVVLALAAVPPLSVLIGGLLGKRIPAGRARAASVVLSVWVIVQFCAGWAVYQHDWRFHFLRRVSQSPHLALASSSIAGLFGTGRGWARPGEYSLDDMKDFQLSGVRGSPGPLPAEMGGRGPSPRNVVVVVLESTGTQHMSLYGSPFATTPRMSAESVRAAVFEDFYSQDTLTASSLFVLCLSTYPEVNWRMATEETPFIGGSSMAQVLGPRGWRTAFITSGDIRWADQDKFLSVRGFDRVIGPGEMGAPELSSWGCEDRHLVDEVFKFIDSDPSKPFYIMGWTAQAHHPYSLGRGVVPRAFQRLGKPVGPSLNRYLNCLLEEDAQVGRLLDGLRERGIADDTLVVVTGDHGEGFGSPHPFFFHGGRIYEENVRVPCMFWNPRLFRGGVRFRTVGGHIDLNPTVLHLLGVPPPPSWQGYSLFDPARSDRAYFFAVDYDYLLGVREGSKKLVYNGNTAEVELYDLTRDPAEQDNIADLLPDTVARLRRRLHAWTAYQRGHTDMLISGTSN